MGNNKTLNSKASIIAVILPVLIIIFPFVYSFFTHAFIQDNQDSQPFLEKPDAKFKNCVKETDFMRQHHWEVLRAVREEVVRYGKRGDISLDKCKDCHTSRERFCKKCHSAVSMAPDCYGCHYYP